jgi:hypothetical protein
MSRPFAAAIVAAALALASARPAGAAYCGCDKPPPEANVAVRPAFAYPSSTILLFSENLVVGRPYRVRFYRAGLLSSGLRLARPKLDATSTAIAVRARDQGDFDPLNPTAPLPLRKQLRVKLPRRLKHGPARIEVIDPLLGARNPVLVVSEDDFTVIGRPIVLTDDMPQRDIPVTTGMSRDGHLFFALDMRQVRESTLIDVRLIELLFPLAPDSVTGWNVQGFNVGTLRNVPDDPRFGWRLFGANDEDANGGNAYRIRYWRHEFMTWEAAHHPGGSKIQVEDPLERDYWHQDGTPHIDHDHIVIAVDVQGISLSQLLRGAVLNLIRLRVSTTPGPNPYADDPNPTGTVHSTTTTTTIPNGPIGPTGPTGSVDPGTNVDPVGGVTGVVDGVTGVVGGVLDPVTDVLDGLGGVLGR